MESLAWSAATSTFGRNAEGPADTVTMCLPVEAPELVTFVFDCSEECYAEIKADACVVIYYEYF